MGASHAMHVGGFRLEAILGLRTRVPWKLTAHATWRVCFLLPHDRLNDPDERQPDEGTSMTSGAAACGT